MQDGVRRVRELRIGQKMEGPKPLKFQTQGHSGLCGGVYNACVKGWRGNDSTLDLGDTHGGGLIKICEFPVLVIFHSAPPAEIRLIITPSVYYNNFNYSNFRPQ